MERLLRMCLLYLNPRNDDETGGGGGNLDGRSGCLHTLQY